MVFLILSSRKYLNQIKKFPIFSNQVLMACSVRKGEETLGWVEARQKELGTEKRQSILELSWQRWRLFYFLGINLFLHIFTYTVISENLSNISFTKIGFSIKPMQNREKDRDDSDSMPQSEWNPLDNDAFKKFIFQLIQTS